MSREKIYYWDSCMFYEWLCDEQKPEEEHAGIKKIILENQKQQNRIITSAITHLEVLPSKLSAKGSNRDDFSNLFDNTYMGSIDMTPNILWLAKDIRDFYFTPNNNNQQSRKMMDLGDAIHLATAIIYKVDEFHTRDNTKKGGKVPLLTLSAETQSGKICNEYDLSIISPSDNQFDLDV
ncbi:MAG: PIN domain-containing protein [Alphaproteobacteria bacterium]|nr:PIN domain-containing protein [Alphaproteobacteria bacterium]